LEIGELIKRHVPASILAVENFFKTVLFNYIFSNGDAHLKNFSLIRNDFGEMELSPSYDLMSTIIHTPNERDTALELFDKDFDLAYYATYGHYGRMEFIEFAKRLGIVEIRYLRIIESFIKKEVQIAALIQNAFLSNAAKQLLLENLQSRLKRLV
jgi:serine/threonine-protein kinase HipA